MPYMRPFVFWSRAFCQKSRRDRKKGKQRGPCLSDHCRSYRKLTAQSLLEMSNFNKTECIFRKCAETFNKSDATQVSGDATEAQTLVAGRHYLNRPSVMESILNTLYNFFRFEKCQDHRGAIDVILAAMDRYPAEKVIQISGSACVCYVTTSDVLERINVRVKRKIFSTLLNGMLAHSDDPVMMRNGCLALSQFRYTGDFVSEIVHSVQLTIDGVFSETIWSRLKSPKNLHKVENFAKMFSAFFATTC